MHTFIARLKLACAAIAGTTNRCDGAATRTAAPRSTSTRPIARRTAATGGCRWRSPAVRDGKDAQGRTTGRRSRCWRVARTAVPARVAACREEDLLADRAEQQRGRGGHQEQLQRGRTLVGKGVAVVAGDADEPVVLAAAEGDRAEREACRRRQRSQRDRRCIPGMPYRPSQSDLVAAWTRQQHPRTGGHAHEAEGQQPAPMRWRQRPCRTHGGEGERQCQGHMQSARVAELPRKTQGRGRGPIPVSRCGCCAQRRRLCGRSATQADGHWKALRQTCGSAGRRRCRWCHWQ